MNCFETVIGIDCATDPRKTGLARAVTRAGSRVLEVAPPLTSRRPMLDLLVNWLGEPGPVLLALDAPLGWPRAMAAALGAHRAGALLAEDAGTIFTRETDRVIRTRTGKKPMDVGAERIARTAAAALRLLAELRTATGRPIPLAWTPGSLPETAAIEVYPAATLKVRGLPSSGYKRDGGAAVRQELADVLRGLFAIDPDSVARMLVHDDALDAGLCCLAGLDFLHGDVIPPEDPQLAQIEGWIWVKTPPTP